MTHDPVMHALVDLVEQLCNVGMEGKLAQAHHNAMKVIRERTGSQPEAAARSYKGWRFEPLKQEDFPSGGKMPRVTRFWAASAAKGRVLRRHQARQEDRKVPAAQ